MNVKVSYFGHLRAKSGKKSETLEVDSSTSVGDLLKPLCRARNIHGEVFGESDQVQTSVNILVNGRNITFLDGLATSLTDCDEISIFPPTGGG